MRLSLSGLMERVHSAGVAEGEQVVRSHRNVVKEFLFHLVTDDLIVSQNSLSMSASAC